MANVKDKEQRDFRLCTSATKPSLDFNKIKIGSKTLKGDLTAEIDAYNRRNGLSKEITKEDVERAINNYNIPELRRISQNYYVKSGIYSRLVRYMAYLYRYDWFITPHRYDDKIKDTKIIEGWYKASTFLENSHLKRTLGQVALNVIKNGCYYGYIIDNKSAAYLQELPVNYCRSRYKLNGKAAVEFNIKFFDDNYSDPSYRLRILKMFPKEFQKAYIAYKNGTLPKDFSGDDNGWFCLDTNYSVKFNIGDSDAPLFISVIPAIMDLEGAKKLDRDKMAQQLLKIIIQKMPIDKNGDLIFDVDEAQALHNNAVQMVGDAIGVDVLTTFADVDVADLSDRSNVSSVDELERVERTVYNEAGVSQKQFNTDSNVALEKSVANDEATMTDLLLQFAEYAESLLAQYNKNTRRLYYRVSMLPTTIYNYKDLAKLYKDQSQIGFSKLLPQVALGRSQSEIIATAIFENDIIDISDLLCLSEEEETTTSTTKDSTANGSSESNGEAGRPELPDDQKSEKTLRNLEAEQ